MAEIADLPDLLAHLETAKQKILDRLKLTPEYQALLTVDKTIKEISEVLELVGEEGSVGVAAASAVAPAPPAKAPTAVPNETAVVGLAALVHESFATQLANDVQSAGDGRPESEKARVA